MLELTNQPLLLGALGIAGLFVGLQLALTVSTLVALRVAARERAQLSKELFGLVKKIEGLTSSRRDQMLKHYDSLLEMLSTRLPPAIAAQTSQVIFETESKILSRLAELEPNIKQDEVGKRKMDDLIKTMEKLEQTIVVLAADTVRSVMVEGRRSLLDDEKFPDIGLAA